MATLEALQTVILDVLQDDACSSDDVTALINQGIRFCAEVVLLPGLEVSNTVNTIIDTSFADIPASWNFNRNLYHCSSPDNVNIKIHNSFGALLQEFPDFWNEQLKGSVERVCIKGNTVVYYPIPTTSIELTCSFYRTPDIVVNDADIPSCLPVSVHEEILENFVLWKYWSRLEDGIEGAKTNTKYYQELFLSAIGTLDTLINYGQSRSRPTIENGWI